LSPLVTSTHTNFPPSDHANFPPSDHGSETPPPKVSHAILQQARGVTVVRRRWRWFFSTKLSLTQISITLLVWPFPSRTPEPLPSPRDHTASSIPPRSPAAPVRCWRPRRHSACPCRCRAASDARAHLPVCDPVAGARPPSSPSRRRAPPLPYAGEAARQRPWPLKQS